MPLVIEPMIKDPMRIQVRGTGTLATQGEMQIRVKEPGGGWDTIFEAEVPEGREWTEVHILLQGNEALIGE
jgi:hypothetical protein